MGGQDYYIDLLFYNIRMHAYVVIDLKVHPFTPEDAGKLNFYINVMNDQMKGEGDNDTIGIILCQGKNEIITRYALGGCRQPIGVSDYECCEAIPRKLKSSLPTEEEVEKALEPFVFNGERGRLSSSAYSTRRWLPPIASVPPVCMLGSGQVRQLCRVSETGLSFFTVILKFSVSL